MSELLGKAQTVLGVIEGKELGVTLPHEHLLFDGRVSFAKPSKASGKSLAYEPVNWKNLSWIRYHPGENLDNLQLFDEQEAIDEAMLFRKAGGNTILDVTTIGIGRDPKALARISRATRLNVIMAAGYYTGPSHDPGMSSKTEDEISEEIVGDINIGVDNSGIRAGIIGEIGCSWPLRDTERKVLRAAAHAQQCTGASLNIHPGFSRKAPFEIIEILGEAGADLSRVIMSHIDVRIRDPNERRRLAETSCCIEYDTWGWEGHFPSYWTTEDFLDLPNDTQRIYEVLQLIEGGYLNQILISHDICRKSQRVRYGGWGYSHISNYVVPMMLKRDMTPEQIKTIMVENPRRLLCFV